MANGRRPVHPDDFFRCRLARTVTASAGADGGRAAAAERRPRCMGAAQLQAPRCADGAAQRRSARGRAAAARARTHATCSNLKGFTSCPQSSTTQSSRFTQHSRPALQQTRLFEVADRHYLFPSSRLHTGCTTYLHGLVYTREPMHFSWHASIANPNTSQRPIWAYCRTVAKVSCQPCTCVCHCVFSHDPLRIAGGERAVWHNRGLHVVQGRYGARAA